MAVVAARAPGRAPAPRSRRKKQAALTVVSSRPRWPAVAGGVLLVAVMAALLGAAVFHTQLAERQLKIDQLERRVQEERARFDELRRDRAVLRSPQRIADEAVALGMVSGQTSRFIDVDPMQLAKQLAASGVTIDDANRVIVETGPLDQFRDVKLVSVGQP
jgi:cell division protein FtsL